MADAVHSPGFYLIRRENGELRCECAKNPKEACLLAFGEVFKGKQAEWQYIGDQSLTARSKEDQDLLIIAGDWNRMDNRGAHNRGGRKVVVEPVPSMSNYDKQREGLTKLSQMFDPTAASSLGEKTESAPRSGETEVLYRAIDNHIKMIEERIEKYRLKGMTSSVRVWTEIVEQFQVELLEASV